MFRELRAFAHLGVLILSTVFAVAQQSPTGSADQTWNELAAGNHRFVLGKTVPHDFLAQRRALTKSQHPRY
jgi:uracil DNA glycosylase